MRQLEVTEGASVHREGNDMRSDFIPHPRLEGEGRCAVCDLPYSRLLPREAEHHRGFHRSYLKALDDGWAPLPERERELLHESAFSTLRRGASSFNERLNAAEAYFRWKLDGYRFGALYYDVEPRTVANYFRERIDAKGLIDQFGLDVAAEMRRRYTEGAVAV